MKITLECMQRARKEKAEYEFRNVVDFLYQSPLESKYTSTPEVALLADDFGLEITDGPEPRTWFISVPEEK